MAKFTPEQVLRLKTLGWDFLPTGLNEWDWLKFSKDGIYFAREGDAIWDVDVATVTEPNVEEVWEPTMELRVRQKPSFGSPHSSYVTEQKFIRVEHDAEGGHSTEWRPLPMVGENGEPL